MNKSSLRPLGIFFALALVMAATRIHTSLLHHFDALPDATWGVLFLAGFWLRGAWRWALPLLLTEAVTIDFLVISNQGGDFWTHYCVSAAYWFLLPAYASLWAGGSWLRRHASGLTPASVTRAVAAFTLSWAACYVISNGSFYWLSDMVPLPRSGAAWAGNMLDWYQTFFTTTAMYAAIGAALHIAVTQLRGVRGVAGEAR